MTLCKRIVHILLIMMAISFNGVVFADDKINIPILCYHNLNPTQRGSMNMTPELFESQIKWIKDNGFTVITLKEAVEYLQGKRDSLPSKPVVITADDGWVSNYTYMLPIIKKYNVPVTLFIYPGTISLGKNALSWEQLKELQKTGLFDIQSHTLTHPNFKQERRRMSSGDFEKFVDRELAESKKVLEEKTGTPIVYLAWPFGIYDDYLEKAAQKAGYDMAFTINYTTANRTYRPMSQPRFMIIDTESNKFPGIVNRATKQS